MIVVDASVAVLALLNAGGARDLLADEMVATLHLADSEVAHTVRRRVLRGEIAADDGRRALGAWGRLGVERYPATGLLPRMWELRENVSAYDAGYVALAEELEVALATADVRLAQAPGPTCPVMVIRR